LIAHSKTWRLGAAVVCTCTVVLAEGGEVVLLAHPQCLAHLDLCQEHKDPPPHTIEAVTFTTSATAS
jgi:hypothetical protein